MLSSGKFPIVTAKDEFLLETSNIQKATPHEEQATSIMSCLPNELWDQIWLERCKLGFEPHIIQAKWVDGGRFYVPAFYTAQR